MSLYIKDETTTQLVNELARRRGLALYRADHLTLQLIPSTEFHFPLPKKATSFCEQKEAKKLYDFAAGMWHPSCHTPAPEYQRFFGAFL